MKLLSESCLWQLKYISTTSDDDDIKKLIVAWSNIIEIFEYCDRFSEQIIRDSINVCLDLCEITTKKINAFMSENDI